MFQRTSHVLGLEDQGDFQRILDECREAKPRDAVVVRNEACFLLAGGSCIRKMDSDVLPLRPQVSSATVCNRANNIASHLCHHSSVISNCKGFV